MKLKVTRRELYHFVITFLLVMAGMNFLNQFFYFFLAAIVLAIAAHRRIVIDASAVCLMLVGLSWVIFSPTGMDSITNMIKPMLYVLAYFAGACYLSYSCKNKNAGEIERIFIRMTVLLSVGPFIHYLLNMIDNWGVSERNTIDFWAKTVLSATNQAAMSCMAISISIGALFAKVEKKYKWLSVAVLLLGAIYNLTLAGRTIFAIIVIVAVISCIYLYVNSKRSRKSKIVLSIVLIAAGLVLCYIYDAFGLKSAIVESNFYYRFFGKNAYHDIESDTRMARKLLFITHFSTGILGGARLRNSGIGYAHDIILDTFDEAGLVAFVAMVVFLIRSGRVFWRFMKLSKIQMASKQIVMSLYIAQLLQFIVEPVLQGAPWMFAMFCFQSGMLGVFLKLQARADAA